jgi:hypothetical protein
MANFGICAEMPNYVTLTLVRNVKFYHSGDL